MLINFAEILIDFPIDNIPPYILFNLILNPVISVLVIWYFLRKFGLPLIKSLLIALMVAIVVIVTSRIADVVIAWDYYQKFAINPWAIEPRGFSMFAGFVLAFPIFYIFCKMIKLNFWKFLDLVTPAWTIGIVFNKIGCLFNGCCFGIPTSLPFGITYPVDTLPYNTFYDKLIRLVGINGDLSQSIALHPVQVYESIIGFTGFLIAVKLLKNKKDEGLTFASFTMFYSLSRLVLDYLRYRPYSLADKANIIPLLYLLVFISTVIIFFYRYKESKSKNKRIDSN